MPRLVTVVVAVLAVLVASACTPDKPGPNYSSVTPTPSTTTPSTPVGSPDSTANVPSGMTSPTEPAAGLKNTSDGAFAFVAYYWKQVDWAYSTVNGDVLNGLYRPTCKSCESSRSEINEVRQKSHSLRGGHLAIQSQKLGQPDADPTASYAIDTTLSVGALTEVDASGKQVAAYPASSYTVRAFIAWATDHFEVTATANLGGG